MATNGDVTLLTLPQLVNVALGAPEMGVVSFGLLHNILQIIVKKLQLTEVKVEYKGQTSNLVKKLMEPRRTQVNLQETTYKVFDSIDPSKLTGEETVIVFSDDHLQKPTATVAMPSNVIMNMSNDIAALQRAVEELNDLPSNRGLIEAVRANDQNATPLVDMYQMLTLSKRLEANEEGMRKMATIIEDIAKGHPPKENILAAIAPPHAPKAQQQPDPHPKHQQQPGAQHPQQPGPNLQQQQPDTYSQKSEQSRRFSQQEPETNVQQQLTGGSMILMQPNARSEDTIDVTHHRAVLGGEVEYSAARYDQPVQQVRQQHRAFPDIPVPEQFERATGVLGIGMDDTNTQGAIQSLQREVAELREMIEDQAQRSGGPAADTANTDARFVQLETGIRQCSDQINDLDTTFNNQFCAMMGHVQEIEKQFGFLSDKVVADLNRGAESEEQTTQNMIQLNEKFLQMETSFEKLGEAVTILMEDKQMKQIKLDSNTEQIEMLKTDKIGREEYEHSMAEKVDVCQINRKVSHDQFNQTCDDLSKGIEEALDKLLQQEELWNVALSEIQEEINSKLNKDDLTPLRDFVTDKLKVLQLKMKNLGQMKRDREAAATKNRLLRDVNCISCDQDAVMRKTVDPGMFPAAPVMPTHQSMAPYLAYELDQLRKQQHLMAYSKNLNHFEDATKQEKFKGIMNRYCGGHHTVTTPQQRVARMGNFLEQWGPAVSPIQDEAIKGRDGHVYRGSETPRANPSLLIKNAIDAPTKLDPNEGKTGYVSKPNTTRRNVTKN